jgi:hypothetical protein
VWTDKLALDGIAPSIGTVGYAYDNALMETINGLYKAECVRTTIFHDGPYKTIADVEYATAGWVDRSQQPTPPVPSQWSAPANTRPPTTSLSTESLSPHRSGTEPGTVPQPNLTYPTRMTKSPQPGTSEHRPASPHQHQPKIHKALDVDPSRRT